MPVSVAAGNGPMALASPATSLFIFSSAAAAECPRDGRAGVGKHAQNGCRRAERVGQLLDGLDHLVNLLQSLGDRLLHVLGGNRLVGVGRRLRCRDGLGYFFGLLERPGMPLSPLFSFRKSPTPGIEDVSATNSNAHALTRFTLHSLRLCAHALRTSRGRREGLLSAASRARQMTSKCSSSSCILSFS